MHIDLRTVTIEPKRKAFDHLVRRFGDKPASRYQEGSYDIQASENLHYRPTWAPDQELYDPELSKIRMADWHALKDPRQFYYSSYTLNRARQQEGTEMNFAFVENQGLFEVVDPAVRQLAVDVLLPLRHAAWGANQNNTFICGYGYGVTFTQPCMYAAMDQLGIAQYLSRLGLLLGGTDALTVAKTAWLEDERWQELRRLVEDMLVVRDPVELWVAQDLALDGLLFPLIYDHFVGGRITREGAAAVAMLTQFQSDWFAESKRWIDAVVKVMAAESDDNRETLRTWVEHWVGRAETALAPIAELALGDAGRPALTTEIKTLTARLAKAGVTPKEH